MPLAHASGRFMPWEVEAFPPHLLFPEPRYMMQSHATYEGIPTPDASFVPFDVDRTWEALNLMPPPDPPTNGGEDSETRDDGLGKFKLSQETGQTVKIEALQSHRRTKKGRRKSSPARLKTSGGTKTKGAKHKYARFLSKEDRARIKTTRKNRVRARKIAKLLRELADRATTLDSHILDLITNFLEEVSKAASLAHDAKQEAFAEEVSG